MTLRLTIWIFLLSAEIICARDNDLSTLRQLQIITRHGARTPTDPSYPGDVNTDFLQMGKGQLTQKGSDEMYEYGLKLKKRYEQFLTNDYRTVYARSSYRTRCLQTGEALLTAVYPRTYTPPGGAGRNYDKVQSGQPIPIYTACDGMLSNLSVTDYEDGALFLDRLFSTRYIESLLRDVTQITQVERYNAKTTKVELLTFYDSLVTEKYHALTLPPWFESVFPRLQEVNKGVFNEWATNTSFSIITAGALFKEVVQNWQLSRTSDGTEIPISTYFYFTHDVMVQALLALLRCPVYNPPPFGATIILEKHQLPDNSTFINFLYKNSSDSEPILLNPTRCDPMIQDSSVENLLKVYSTDLNKI